MNDLKCWQIDDGESHWYAANTSDEALDLHREEFYILMDDEYMDDVDICEFPLDSELTVSYDYGEEVITKTAEEWVDELGVGLICSTAYGYV